MDLVIQKYGGTSLGDAGKIRRVARRIAAADGSVVAVVSAMGRTTNSMIELARDLTDTPHARELDLLLSTGEQASAAALAIALHELGVPARSFSAHDCGIITDGVHGRARIVNVDPVRIRECVQDGHVPVVSGFQGLSADNGELTTLSRGGSDTTAVALAAALRARVCEIFTDVEGVFTADPRHVADARKVDRLFYEDMAELAACGATVLAHPSVEYAGAHRVPVHVRSSTTEAAGTWVTGFRSAAPLDGERFTAVGVAHRTGQLRCSARRGRPRRPDHDRRRAGRSDAAGGHARPAGRRRLRRFAGVHRERRRPGQGGRGARRACARPTPSPDATGPAPWRRCRWWAAVSVPTIRRCGSSWTRSRPAASP
ncbi:aspartate kinase [Nonomuraea ferruginea]